MANGPFSRERIGGLLGDPRFLVGAGLLGGQTLPQATAFAGQQQAAISDREQQALRNQAMRESMAQRQRQQKAMQQLPGLLADTTIAQGPATQVRSDDPLGINVDVPGQQRIVPTIQTPQGRQEALGLIAQADPEAFTQSVTGGLLGQMFPQQERAEPSQARLARILADPNESQEVKDEIRTQLETDASVTDQQLALLDLQQRQMKLLQTQSEISARESAERQSEAQLTVDLRNDLNNTRRLATLNNRLKDTALETGIPMSDMRRAASSGTASLGRLIGVDTSEAQKMIADFDEFKKLAQDFAIKSATRMFDRGDISNMQLQSVVDSSVGPSVAPETNDQILSKTIGQLLSWADVAGIPVKDRDEFESLMGDLSERREQTRVTEPAVDVPAAAQRAGARARDIGRMGAQQLQQMDFDAMTQEQRDAVARRLDELGL